MKLNKYMALAVVLSAINVARTASADDISSLGAGVQNYVTGTMEGAYAWYEQGFDPNAPMTGLPPAGIVQSQANPNWSFRLQLYSGNNVQLLNANNRSGQMTFSTAVSANAIAIATATAIGPALLSPTIHFSDGTPDYIPNLFTEPDWFQSTGPILANAHGRIQIFPNNVPGFPLPDVPGRFDNASAASIIPIRIDTIRMPDSLAAHPISSITMNWTLEQTSIYYTSNTAVFAISTSTDGGNTFAPGDLTASSFNKDLVVEAAALPEPAGALFIAISVIAMTRRRGTAGSECPGN